MIPESIRKLETNASLFSEDGCSVPVLGTICTTDVSPQAQQMLSLLGRRNSLSFILLVAFPESAEAEGEVLTPNVRRTRVLSALQQIDDANGKSIKDGASNKYREFFVDKEGRPSVSGTIVYAFDLNLAADRLATSPLVQESLAAMKLTAGKFLITDPVLIHQWPRHGTKGEQVLRILVPSSGQAAAMHLVHSCQVFDVAVQEVQRALAAIEQPHRKDLILYPDVVDFNDGTALCTFNPVLMSYLLIMCPSFGSATSSSYSQGIRAIRLLPTSDVTSFSAVGLDGDSPMGDVATTGPKRSTPMTRSAWSKPPMDLLASRTARVTKIAEIQPLHNQYLLNILPARDVFQYVDHYVGPPSILAFPYNATGMDIGQLQGEVAWLIIRALAVVPGISPHELTIERWAPCIGALTTWSPEGPRITKILVQVRPGANHALVVDALHGNYLACDRNESQCLFAQYGLCQCDGCQQHRRDTTGSGCIDCTRKDHLAGDSSCPRILARIAYASRRRELTAAAAGTLQTPTASSPSVAEAAVVVQPSSKRPAEEQDLEHTNADSSDTASSPLKPPLPTAKPVPHTSDLAHLPSSSPPPQTTQPGVANASDTKGRGRGRGRGVVMENDVRGSSSGKGSGKKEIIPWLCPFCNRPTGTSELHNSKQCNRPLKLTPPSELSTARCAICDHHHLFVDCTILHDQRLGMSIMPSAFLRIAERLGYQVDKVGDRRVINCKAALAAHSGTSIAGNSANAGSASSQETSLEVGKSSTMSQDLQDALTLFGQKEQALSDQMASLQGVVSALSAGQGSLQKKQEVLQGQLAAQAANSLAILKSLSQLRTDFEKARDKHEQNFTENASKYEATMAEIQKQLGVVGTGVKGPHDTVMHNE